MIKQALKYLSFSFLFCSFYVQSDNAISKIIAPDGFVVDLFAKNLDRPRQMAESANGWIFVASKSRDAKGVIYAIKDTDRNGKVDSKRIIANNLYLSSGVAFHQGDLFFSEVDKIWKIKDIDEWLDTIKTEYPTKALVFDGLPKDSWHGYKWLMVDIEGDIYLNVGAPCNVCIKDDDRYSTILKIENNQVLKILARGVRNSVGFDWSPVDGKLYFTDNGRDWMGDDIPSCELNRLDFEGEFFGFPYLHATDVIDPDFGHIEHGYAVKKPLLELGAHVAPTGMAFYDKDLFPNKYLNSAFITLHGSWNRSKKVGYKVINVQFDSQGSIIGVEDFLTGFLDNEKAWGRPGAPYVMNDGSLLISDDKSGNIYRVIPANP